MCGLTPARRAAALSMSPEAYSSSTWRSSGDRLGRAGSSSCAQQDDVVRHRAGTPRARAAGTCGHITEPYPGLWTPRYDRQYNYTSVWE